MSPALALDMDPPTLSSMPPEVGINIFSQLPCLQDVLIFSSTSYQFQNIWLSSVAHICNTVAPRSISCLYAARQFIVDQSEPGLDSPMSTKDMVRLVRNADVVEGAILRFEREIVSRVKSKRTSVSLHHTKS